jgi:hypothetical protein
MPDVKHRDNRLLLQNMVKDAVDVRLAAMQEVPDDPP